MFKRRWLWITILLLFVSIVTFSYWRYLAKWNIPNDPDQLTIYSIYSKEDAAGLDPNTIEKIWNLPVLGKIEITDGHQRHELMDALKSGMGPEMTGSLPIANHLPRHVVRLTSGGREIVFIIYFEDKHVSMHIGASGKFMSTTDRALPLFNKVLKDGGEPMAAPKQKS